MRRPLSFCGHSSRRASRYGEHPPRPHPQHRHLGAHRLRQDDAHRAHPLLHGRIHEIHEVRGKDGVGAKMDSMDLEREKGITIQSAATYCVWNGLAGAARRPTTSTSSTRPATSTSPSRWSARSACSTARSSCSTRARACSSQSITVDRQMKRYHVPRIAFVNKMDNPGANYERVADMLKEKLGHHPVPHPGADGRRGQVRGHHRPHHRQGVLLRRRGRREHPRGRRPRRVRGRGQEAPREDDRRTSPTSTTRWPRSSSTRSRSPSTSSAPPSAARPSPSR